MQALEFAARGPGAAHPASVGRTIQGAVIFTAASRPASSLIGISNTAFTQSITLAGGG